MDTHLAKLLQVNSVTFDASEQKTLDRQPIKIAYYKINVTVLAPACVMVSGKGSWTFTSDRTLCDNGFPQMPVGHSGTYSIPSTWKLTEQGWRLAGKGSLMRFAADK